MCSTLLRPPHRDRHGRGQRGPTFFPGSRAWMTRKEAFDRLVADVVAELTRRWPAVSTIEFAVEDVPPSAPAPWEDHGVVTARIFPADRRRGLSDRIVVYRLSVLRRCSSEELPQFLLQLLAERISHLLVIDPDDLDELLG